MINPKVRYDWGLKWRLLLGLALDITLTPVRFLNAAVVTFFLPDFLTGRWLQGEDVGFLLITFSNLIGLLAFNPFSKCQVSKPKSTYTNIVWQEIKIADRHPPKPP